MRSIKITPTITRRDERSLDHYLREIAQYDILTPEEEYNLFMQRSEHPNEVIDKIVKHNLRFVVSVAKKYQDCGFPLVSLINEGNLGLVKAAKRFDPTRGFKFISYAVWWIRQSILSALNEKSRKIRTPVNIQSVGSKITRFQSDFMQHNEREPEIHEIATGLDMKESRVEATIRSMQKCASIDAKLNEDSDTTMAALIADTTQATPDENLVVHETNRQEVDQMLEMLDPKQAFVVRSYFGIDAEYPKSLTDIADELDISKERIRQIRDRSVRKLQTFYRRKNYGQANG